MPKTCAKNVYRVGSVSGKLGALRTGLMKFLNTAVYSSRFSAQAYPVVFPQPIHKKKLLITPVFSLLSPLSTAPIISSYELKERRMY